ncbi:ABC transporter permease [Desulfosarcina alkanivorans]|uniref:ABC transporter permease n=1 Tax=Desulfosarcina alkanivorans TaxID=571177 RepID=A0A5K7YJN2_9BACT|nr:ABC transporter permease [Desulfosarcina alkanivorans]BBO69416.1 ABC transporter permease [Desulfosarcina alkanivorans]
MNRRPSTPGLSGQLMPWILPACFLVAWMAACETGLVPGYLLPHPKDIFATASTYIFSDPGQDPYAGRFVEDLLASTMRVMTGFGLAVAAGIPLGIVSGRIALVNRMLSMTINALRAVPGISWLPLAMVWFGIGMKTTVFLVALAAFFPIFLNAEAGARQVSPILLQAGAMMGVHRLRGTFAILIPAAMPQIITGLRLGMGISWAYLVLGELTGVPNGLGAVIMDARMLGRIDIIIVGILMIALVGRLCDLGLHGLLRGCFKSARRLP